MDSNRIKNLAFGARDALRGEVAARIGSVLADGSPERLDHPDKVRALEKSIEENGLESVVESTAYTWFNRLCALRFMDAKGYTPVPAVTPRPGATQPAVLADAAQGVFDPDYGFSRLVRDRVQSILSGTSAGGSNRTEAAYTVLLIAVCDHYSKAMPYLFGEAAASSLIVPSGLLAEGSILRRIVEEMDDTACESVEVLGWLYQFYVAERKDEFFASKRKAGPDDIAPATQLFTPNWIVRYLVENSLGRLWMLNNPGSAIADKMDYYIVPEGEVEDFIRVYSPEELTLCDPACGSGHILVYAFDLLYEIYLEEGYLPEDIPALILQKNLFGMEIDGRAAEIAKFALEMKAREKDPAFFDKCIDANVTVLEAVGFEAGELAGLELLRTRVDLLDAFTHMSEVGSLYVPQLGDMEAAEEAIARLDDSSLLDSSVLARLKTMKRMLEALSRRFDCVVANPPYMGDGDFGDWLKSWLCDYYKNEKTDLCVCFIKRSYSLAISNGYIAMITMRSWMTLKSFLDFRDDLLHSKLLLILAEFGPHAFDQINGEIVSTIAFSISNSMPIANWHTKAIDLTFGQNEEQKNASLLSRQGLHEISQNAFSAIPDHPVVTNASNEAISAFQMFPPFSQVAVSKPGMQTSDNERFLREWHEVSFSKIGFALTHSEASASSYKWYPYNKGIGFRKWYGNNLLLVNFEHDGEEIKKWLVNNPKDPSTKHWSRNMRNYDFYYKDGLTYTAIGQDFSSRRNGAGYLFDTKGPMIFSLANVSLNYMCGFTNSSVFTRFNQILSRQLTRSSASINNVPFLKADRETATNIESLVSRNIDLSKEDWDSFENSWDFKWHALAPSSHEREEQFIYGIYPREREDSVSLISARFDHWAKECAHRFEMLKSNERELNRIFAHLYQMESEVPIDVDESKVTICKADIGRDIKSLVSYGVGCLMGRYSVYEPGLILADAGQTLDDFVAKVPNAAFKPDEDAIIPVLDGEWFPDDIVFQFRKWLECTYGKETLDENVSFIESALGKDLRTYFVKDFYKDHCATYQVTGSGKRPIYWMFSSPKGGFQALVYMHRYTPSTVGQILTKYLREYIEKLSQEIGRLDQSNRAADNRQADKYRGVVKALSDWERDVMYPLANEHIAIDLDDGVKANYNKFPHALAKVAGLSTWK